jgi:2-polyprenyl-3-methyl-5-hydroxy-6-metoxy-1,4-benzoquinol methylase
MKKIDLYLQKKRLQKTEPYISSKTSVLDIGSNNGDLFQFYKDKGININGIGVDPNIQEDKDVDGYSLVKDYFPSAKINGKFNVITALAVMEHIPEDNIPSFIQSFKNSLLEDGRVIITVPHPLVDVILYFLKLFRLIEGMETEQHYGLKIKTMKKLFSENGFKLEKHKYFQFGLNNLFVFK